MKLQPYETVLVGTWIAEGNEVRSDAICERIEQLIANHLRQIAISQQWGAWETLFQDPDDGRYWERTYPQGELQGGGPPQLRCLLAVEAKQKYGDAELDGRTRLDQPLAAMPPVTNTSPEVAAIVRDRIMKLSGAERFVIGARMFESARTIVQASLPEDISEPERKRMLFERFYGETLPSARDDSRR